MSEAPEVPERNRKPRPPGHNREWYARNLEVKRAKARAYYHANREARRDYQASYNATNRAEIARKQQTRNSEKLGGTLHAGLPEAAMWLQESSCAICHHAPPPDAVHAQRLHFDHDHATGQFRGWLCMSCNTALGKFRDDPALLQRAIEYLANPPATLHPSGPQCPSKPPPISPS